MSEPRVAAAIPVQTPSEAEVVTPESEEELAEILARATAQGRVVSIWGGGTHRDIGYPVEPDLVISTAALTGIEDWEPDDLTVVVRAGTLVEELETRLAEGGQTAVLPEFPGAATVGGVVATASSSYRRLRYGPTRDRMLEVRAVTGDGRIIKGGGRVVKNVSGYDLPRLYTGSLGSLGVITSVCLKLWPRSEAEATVRVDEVPGPELLYRPLAILETGSGITVLLAGTGPEVEDQVRRLGGRVEANALTYPAPFDGDTVWSLRVRPSLLAEARSRLPSGVAFVIQHQVGEVSFAPGSDFDPGDLRAWAEAGGGALVRVRGQGDDDPWGTPPPGLELQRRVVAAFDPARILEPGRLPGGI
jgi:glycolate oxidase FAD binding subunit